MTDDPIVNAVVERDLPGLTAALDGGVMRTMIAEAILDRGVRLSSCVPGKIKYLPGETCIVRYDLEIDGVDWVVGGRVFPDADTAARYVRERLEPLAERVAERAAQRGGFGPFSRLAADLGSPAVAVSVFPVDADLPALVEATDPQAMLERLCACLHEVYEVCEITPVAYARYGRCVLRYDLDPDPASGRPRRTVYGKLTTGGDGVHAPAVLDRLAGVFSGNGGTVVNLPRPLDYDERLGLLLMDPVEGTREVPRLMAAWDTGETAAVRSLEDTLDVCARIGALLHTSGVSVDAPRTVADELGTLRADLHGIERIDPALSDRLGSWLDRAERLAAQTAALPSGLAHGDFTISQILFDRRGAVTLLDFDDVCHAEPALDLGQFSAYLKLGSVKRAGSGARVVPLIDRFLDHYAKAAGQHDPELLADRHAVHELCAFVRLASNAWHKLKGARLANVLDALEGASSWQHRAVR